MATCLFSIPVTTRANTSASRGVKVRIRSRTSLARASSRPAWRALATARSIALRRSCLATGLTRKSTAPAFIALTLAGNVAVARDEDDGESASRGGQRLLQIEPGQAGHPHVQRRGRHGASPDGARQEFASRDERLDGVAGAPEQARQALADGRVIVHQEDRAPRQEESLRYAPPRQREGECRAAAPRCSAPPAGRRGPRRWTARSPTPCPFRRAWSYRTRRRCGPDRAHRSRSRNPAPSTRTAAALVPAVRRTSIRSPAAESRIASRPFRTRFRITCCSCTRSPRAARKLGGELEANRDVAEDRVTAHEARHFAHTSPTSSDGKSRLPFLRRPRSRWITSPARLSSSTMSARISRISWRFTGVGLEEILGRLGVAQDRRQRLVQFMGQRRGELPHCRDPADVGQIAAGAVGLRSPPAGATGCWRTPPASSCSRCISSSGQTRSVPRRAEHEGAEERAAGLQRNSTCDLMPSAQVRLGGPAPPPPAARRSARSGPPRPASRRASTQGMPSSDTVAGACPLRHPGVRDPRRSAVMGELRQVSPILREEVRDPAERALDLAIDLVPDKLLNVADCSDMRVSKRSRSASDRSRRFRSSAPANTSAQQPEPPHEFGRPGPLAHRWIRRKDAPSMDAPAVQRE